MKYTPRWAESHIKSLFKHFPAVAVSGARQVGKSTLLKKIFPKVSDFIVFDPDTDLRQARAEPELFVRNLKWPVVLDEIQYSPQIIPALKRRIDEERKPGMVLITGSQQWPIIKNLSESMAGRVAFCDLMGFAWMESRNIKQGWFKTWLDFAVSRGNRGVPDLKSLRLNVFEYLWRGSFPEANRLPLAQIPAFLLSYQRTYLERDARKLADVSDWDQFVRFFRLVAALSSQEINYSEFGRDIGINPQTAKRWLSVLKGTFQWDEIPAFFNNAVKKVSERPKGMLCDTGLICHLQGIGSPEALSGHPQWGAVFETAVVNDIKKQLLNLRNPHAARLYHFRNHSGSEVDLVIDMNGMLFPVEIKGKTNPTRNDTRGITAFREQYGKKAATGAVVCLCEQSHWLSEDAVAIPWDGR
ncbi:MAG: hypothetical protein A2583_13265 [Bdellovibrionales bacterium RIFOXYD1_FULL_53_11]|nr:MAG: hypothetical protein A2583_13265 [Bdellovibrionales bacterium RIFOXYD1_FULL_53_11]